MLARPSAVACAVSPSPSLGRAFSTTSTRVGARRAQAVVTDPVPMGTVLTLPTPLIGEGPSRRLADLYPSLDATRTVVRLLASLLTA